MVSVPKLGHFKHTLIIQYFDPMKTKYYSVCCSQTSLLIALAISLSVLTLSSSLMSAVSAEPAANSGPRDHDCVIFDNSPIGGAYYYSKTESSGPSWVLNLSSKLPVRSTPAFTPGSSLELSYISKEGGNWNAKIQKHPIRGIDDWDNGVFIQSKPTPYKKPAFFEFHIKSDDTADDAMPRLSLLLKENKTSNAIQLSKKYFASSIDGWTLVKIPLSEFTPEISVAEQVQGLQFEQAAADGKSHTIYLDQIVLSPKEIPALKDALVPELSEARGYERHVDLTWTKQLDETVQGIIVERSLDGRNYVPVAYRPKRTNRCADWLGDQFGKYNYRICFLGYDGKKSKYSNVISANTKPLTDEELLDMVQEASARYYWDGAEENSGLTLESIPGDPHMIATGASGFGIIALVVAADRGFLPRKQVAQRMEKILNFLEKQDHFHGAMAHYYDGRTAKPILFFGPDDDGGDMVETSFLMQGLLTARQFFDAELPQEKQIRERISKLWEAVEWDWYRKSADNPYLVWHWSPTVGFKINHRLIGWNESMITYLLAIASPTHSVPKDIYYSGWASQAKEAQEYRGNAAGKMYTNGDTYYGEVLPVGGFTGGPLFFTHYNFLGMNPHGLKDKFTDYFENSKALALINLRYCMLNPQHHQGYGDDAWGLTASDGPWAYNPDEPRPEGDKGKITPTGALASMPYLPVESMNALKNYYRKQGNFLWGDYGFRDAYSPDDNWVNDLYMGLNQAPIVAMIENYRTGRVWKLFGSNKEIANMRASVFTGK